MKLWCFFVLLTNVIAGDIYAGGLGDVKHIPDPDVQIKLPDELIGEFEFPAWNEIPGIYYVIEIHENNKFLWRMKSPDFLSSDQGYVIEERGDYYFIPAKGYWGERNYYIPGKTKITLTENGFSFIGFDNDVFVAVRKRENTNGGDYEKADAHK